MVAAKIFVIRAAYLAYGATVIMLRAMYSREDD